VSGPKGKSVKQVEEDKGSVRPENDPNTAAAVEPTKSRGKKGDHRREYAEKAQRPTEKREEVSLSQGGKGRINRRDSRIRLRNFKIAEGKRTVVLPKGGDGVPSQKRCWAQRNSCLPSERWDSYPFGNRRRGLVLLPGTSGLKLAGGLLLKGGIRSRGRKNEIKKKIGRKKKRPICRRDLRLVLNTYVLGEKSPQTKKKWKDLMGTGRKKKKKVRWC